MIQTLSSTSMMDNSTLQDQEPQLQQLTSKDLFVKKSITSVSFEGKKLSQLTNNINITREEEKKFLQDTQESVFYTASTTADQMSDESTVDGEDDNLQYIASEILKEKRTYYYQVKKQVIKKINLGTRQTENTKQKRWSLTEEVAFWQLLAKFGTNFEFIAKEIKTKTRKQVMLKFNREDKKNATQVDQALKGQIPSVFTTDSLTQTSIDEE